jgi:hypothetical protein
MSGYCQQGVVCQPIAVGCVLWGCDNTSQSELSSQRTPTRSIKAASAVGRDCL